MLLCNILLDEEIRLLDKIMQEIKEMLEASLNETHKVSDLKKEMELNKSKKRWSTYIYKNTQQQKA